MNSARESQSILRTALTDFDGFLPRAGHLDGGSGVIYTSRHGSVARFIPAGQPYIAIKRTERRAGKKAGQPLVGPGAVQSAGISMIMDLKKYIRDVPDFPEPGIIFKDITPLLGDVEAFDYTITQLVDHYKTADIDVIVPVESRGFLFGAPLARELGKCIVPVRKPGKLPAATLSTDYELEYGTNTMEIHVDGVEQGQKVLILDDLLATGGTLAATARLVEMSGGVVAGIGVIIELSFLAGRENLAGYDLYSMIQY